MSKFYVGQKVLVTGSGFIPLPEKRSMIGTVCEVKNISVPNQLFAIWNSDKSYWGNFKESDLQPINETTQTLAINGVEYIRKPEPVVEHEWKLGDVAVHESYGVVVVGPAYHGGELRIFTVDNFSSANPSSLTFIRRADLSV